MKHLNKLYNIDARKISDIIKNTIIDVTITSPPYFNMKNYGYKNQIGFGQKYEQYLEDIQIVFRSVFNSAKDTGCLWVIIDTFKDKNGVVPLPFDFADRIKRVGWKLQDIIIWNKGKTVPWSSKGQTQKKFEYILFFSKSNNFKYYTDRIRNYDTTHLKKWWIRYPERYNPKGKAPQEIWNYDIPTQGSWGNGYIRHFCPLPTDMIGKMIQLTSNEGDIILDPFAGAGSVLAQAFYMNRKYIGFEMNKGYVDMFKSYIRKTGYNGRKQYNTLKTSKYTQDKFARTILNLRCLKFARSIRKQLNKKHQNIIKLIYVDISEDSPIDKHKIKKVNYVIWLDKTRLKQRKRIEKEIKDIITQPPLSKFGIEPNLKFCINKTVISNLTKKQHIYAYTDRITHRYTKKYNINEGLTNFMIISPIRNNIDEKDFQ